MSITVDVFKFPLVSITYLYENFKDSEIHSANSQIESLLSRSQPFVLLSDMTAGSPLASQCLSTSPQLLTKYRDIFRKLILGNCLAMNSSGYRAMFRSALLVSRPPFRVQFESTRGEAEKWCTQLLASEAATRARDKT